MGQHFSAVVSTSIDLQPVQDKATVPYLCRRLVDIPLKLKVELVSVITA